MKKIVRLKNGGTLTSDEYTITIHEYGVRFYSRTKVFANIVPWHNINVVEEHYDS